MILFMYYETDGDSGYYGIKLFSTMDKALAYKKFKNNAYGRVTDVGVDEAMPIEEVLCPECNKKMKSRTGKYGVFWGCSDYPNCRGTRDSMGRSKAERDAAKETEEEVEPSAVDKIAENDKYRFRKE